jgi:hypothetical protein
MFNADEMELTDERPDLVFGFEARVLIDGRIPSDPIEDEDTWCDN